MVLEVQGERPLGTLEDVGPGPFEGVPLAVGIEQEEMVLELLAAAIGSGAEDQTARGHLNLSWRLKTFLCRETFSEQSLTGHSTVDSVISIVSFKSLEPSIPITRLTTGR